MICTHVLCHTYVLSVLGALISLILFAVFSYSLGLVNKDCAAIFALLAHSLIPPTAVSSSTLSRSLAATCSVRYEIALQTSLAIHDHLVASLQRAY